MNNKTLLFSSLLVTTLAFSLATFKVCYSIAENKFFDKFFYQKSIAHGYRINDQTKLSDYGQRGKYIVNLDENKPIIDNTDQQKYTVSIIGDSYVWGLGIRNDQRFSVLLEKKLNQIRPTVVISVGEMGNSTLDYLRRYNQIKSKVKTNLNIFALVSNDAFLSRNQDYLAIEENCQKLFPDVKPIYDIYHELDNNQDYSDPKVIDLINQAHNDSWTNPINLCVEKTVAQALPNENTIYFVTDDYTSENINYVAYSRILSDTGKTILTSAIGKDIPQYKPYWSKTVYQNFQVSQSEAHPNALANQMYANILFKEITTNPKWGFKK